VYKQRVRLEAIALLGGSCVHCGVNDPVVLNIDHVQDDGAQERRKLNPDGGRMCRTCGNEAQKRYAQLNS